MSNKLLIIDGEDFTGYIDANGGYGVTRNDVESDKAGRTMDATMHRDRIAVKMKLQIKCRPLTGAECKKLLNAIYPEYVTITYNDPRVGIRDNVEMYYRGTLINGEEFDGNFEGYGATDQQIPLDPAQMKWPTAFDEPTVMNVSNNMLNGVEWVLQHARTGERWIIYVPYYDGVGYGESDYNSIRGCSVLTFDYIIGDIVEDAD